MAAMKGARRKRRQRREPSAGISRYLGGGGGAGTRGKPSRKGPSGGYHGDLSIPGYKPKTPTVAPPSSEAAKGPAGSYPGAKEAYVTAVEAMPKAARDVTTEATVTAAKRRYKRAHETKREQQARSILATGFANRAVAKPHGPKPSDFASLKFNKSGLAVEQTKPKPKSRPKLFYGVPTAGAPKLSELRQAKRAGKLDVSRRGFVTTPRVRRAAKRYRRAKKAYAKAVPSLAGLSADEKRVFKEARIAHRQYPDVPVSLLMALTRQESGFDPEAISSAGAQGLTQFIPSTAASYGVEYGAGKRERQSQETGAARLLSASGFKEDPWGALEAYTGGYSKSEYPVLEGQKDYLALDKPGNPKVAKRLARAKAEAQAVGLRPQRVVVKTEGTEPKTLPKGSSRYFVKVDGSEHLRFVPVFAKQLIKLAKASGEPLHVNSGFRTYNEQVESYKDYQEGGTLAAVPGTSNHEFGLAADIDLTANQNALLSKFGLGLPVEGEPWHVELTDPSLRSKAGYDSPGSVNPTAYAGSTGGAPSSGTPTTTMSPAEAAIAAVQQPSKTGKAGQQGTSALQTLRNLESLGLGGGRDQAEPSPSPVLAALKRKYE